MSGTESKNSAEHRNMNQLPPQSMQHAAADFDEVIIHLYPNDVLFGRGSGPNDHEGNIRFRVLVGARKEEYMATNHRQTKAKIARDIVNQVLALNGRFLKKVETADAKRRGVPKGVDAWTLADDETIMEKAKQALRQHRDKAGEKSPTNSPVPQPKSTLAHSQLHLENFSNNPPYGTMRPGEINIPSMSRITADSPLSSDYSPASMHMHPNPYEPIPLRTHNPHPSSPLDWRDHTSSNVNAHHPSYSQAYNAVQQQHQMEQMQAAQSLQQMSDRMQPPGGMDGADGQNPQATFRVVELTDSLNKLKTRNDYGNSGEFNESSDTMGTIDPIPMNNSREVSTFSGVSMSSSTFSLMKGALESNRGLDSTTSMTSSKDLGSNSVDETESKLDPFCNNPRATLTRSSGGRGLTEYAHGTRQALHEFRERPGHQGGERPSLLNDPRRGSINIDDKDFFKHRSSQKLGASGDMSMTFSQVWREEKNKNQAFINHAIREGEEDEEHDSRKRVAGKPPADPRPVDMMDDEPDNMSSLGKSSMSILNIAMGESVDSALLTAPNDSIFSDIGD
jgi:hypothetical protein